MDCDISCKTCNSSENNNCLSCKNEYVLTSDN